MIPMWVSRKERKRRGRVGGSCRSCGSKYDESGNCRGCLFRATSNAMSMLVAVLTEEQAKRFLFANMGIKERKRPLLEMFACTLRGDTEKLFIRYKRAQCAFDKANPNGLR